MCGFAGLETLVGAGVGSSYLAVEVVPELLLTREAISIAVEGWKEKGRDGLCVCCLFVCRWILQRI